jgi:diguanylate cyclase (GGDEF)-like protein
LHLQTGEHRTTRWVGWPVDAVEEAQPRDPLAAGKLGLITREVSARAGAQAGLLAVFERADRPGEVVSAWGTTPWEENLPSSLPADRFLGRVLESGHAAVEAIGPDHELAMQASGTHLTWAAAAAVRPPGGPRAALCVAFQMPPRRKALTLWLLERYAGLAALSLHDQAALDGLLRAAVVDGLTGCLNHEAVRSELHREIARSDRHGRALSCCFIDLDRFKLINDDHGHLVGSRVLAEVAAAIRDGLRAEDGLGRYGGDEFLAVLPETDASQAHALAERLRARISRTTVDGRRLYLDASIGIARWRPGATLDELIESADRALLEAKRAGGAAVVEADSRVAPNHNDQGGPGLAGGGGMSWTGAM